MIAESVVYDILLKVGQHVNNLQADFQAIWASFGLPSWFASIYDVRILTHSTGDNSPPFFRVWIKPNLLDPSHVVELYFFYVRNDRQRTINYYVQTTPPPSKESNQIQVSFHKDTEEKCIHIMVQDRKGFLKELLGTPQEESYLQVKQDLKEGELQYFYIEPEDIRYKEELTKNHFHLAFQGGGCKGIAYMGAYKALKDLHSDYQIGSVIGSSAGGMIALGIATGGSFEELFGICNKMQNIPLDQTIKTVEELTPDRLLKYAEIRSKLKRSLHDYGLVCNEVFDLIVDEVFTPEVIEKMFEILSADNQSIGEMLKLEVEEEIIQHKCCSSRVIGHERKVRLLSYYGLLEGKLLRGEEFQKIALEVIKRFLKRTLTNQRDVFLRVFEMNEPVSLGEEDLDFLTKRLTMKTFYDLCGVEFTVTSVDLNAQQLRFFNHKTTPLLPVSKAVLMSGSFPIAFESLAWRKEWGKYYIHYGIKRKEIDLTDHKFTDGGMLANFPMIFLDNEEMRPMYFSHRPNHLTKLFGFGLEQITEEPSLEVQRIQKQRMDQLRSELSDLISKHLPKLKFIYYQLKYVPRPEVVSSSELIPLEDIPLVGLFYKMLSTYMYANDNLVTECFQRKIYFLPISYTMAQSLKPISQTETERNMARLKEALVNYFNAMSKRPCDQKALIDELAEDINLLQSPHVTIRNVYTIKQLLREMLVDFVMYHEDQPNGEAGRTNEEFQSTLTTLKDECSRIIDQLKQVGRCQNFVYCNTLPKDSALLKQICANVLRIFSLSQTGNSREALKQYIDRFGMYVREKELTRLKNISSIIMKTVFKNRHSIHGEVLEEDQSQKMDINDSELVHSLSQFYHSIPRRAFQSQFGDCRKQILDLGNLFLKQQLVFDAEKRKMGTYIEERLRNRRSNNIHLVFQSVGEYNKTSFEIYKLVNEYVFLEENTKAEYYCEQIVDSILRDEQQQSLLDTEDKELKVVDLVRGVVLKCALLAFVSENFSRLWQLSKIELEMTTITLSQATRQRILETVNMLNQNSCKITSLTCSSMHCYFGFLLTTGFKQQRIQRELESLREYFSPDVRGIHEEFNRKDWILPFKCKVRELQDMLWSARYNLFGELEKAARQNRLASSLQQIRMQFESSKETIMNSYSDIMEFLMASEDKANHEKSFAEYLASRMALNIASHNFYKDNKQISEDTKQLVDLVLSHFYDQLRFLVYSLSPTTMKEFLKEEQDPQKREALWKGILISRFLKCDKLKKRIHDVLKEMNLPKDIRLKDFHEVVTHKLELTFTVVDITNKKITFINHHTFPEMPIWAAVVTGSSFPILFPEVHSLAHWVEKIDANAQERYLRQFFSDGQYKRPPIFTAGNLLSSIPLELLTNRKIRERCFEGKDYTFLNFGVTRDKPDTNLLIRDFNRKFLTLGQIISIGGKSLTKAAFGVQQMIEPNAGLISKGKFIETYVLSHDNLILELYYNSVLRLPVRLGTLEFHKLGKKVEGQDLTLSDKTIDQTYYCTKEKFIKKRVTYLEIRLYQGNLRLRFLSKERSNKDIKSNYKIEYKLESKWEPVRDQQIYIKSGTRSINLKFYYVEQREKDAPYRPLLESSSQINNIRESEYQIELSKFFSVFSQFCGIFEFPYSQVFNKNLHMVGPPSKSVLRNIKRRDSIDNIFECRAVVQLFRTGLYCEKCSSGLKFLRQDDRPYEDVCSKCQSKKIIRFECKREYHQDEDCMNKYCFKCSKNQSILRTAHHLMCFNYHDFVYVNRKLLAMRTKAIPTRCDLCLTFNESYFNDSKCDIHICQSCCAEFTAD